jgi:hypothetical protein
MDNRREKSSCMLVASLEIKDSDRKKMVLPDFMVGLTSR